jgi:hypothetical protein
MIKFGKFKKTGPFGFVFRTMRFLKFHNRNKEKAKPGVLKILIHLMHGKRVKNIREAK